MIDGANHHVWILNRETLQVIARFGQQGLFGGSLNVPHAIAVDSRGNIYVGENFDARRFQRFLYKGLGTPVPGANPPTTIVFPRSGRTVTRAVGDLLWPAREGAPEIAAQQAALGAYAYAGQYQQRPSPRKQPRNLGGGDRRPELNPVGGDPLQPFQFGSVSNDDQPARGPSPRLDGSLDSLLGGQPTDGPEPTRRNHPPAHPIRTWKQPRTWRAVEVQHVTIVRIGDGQCLDDL